MACRTKATRTPVNPILHVGVKPLGEQPLELIEIHRLSFCREPPDIVSHPLVFLPPVATTGDVLGMGDVVGSTPLRVADSTQRSAA